MDFERMSLLLVKEDVADNMKCDPKKKGKQEKKRRDTVTEYCFPQACLSFNDTRAPYPSLYVLEIALRAYIFNITKVSGLVPLDKIVGIVTGTVG